MTIDIGAILDGVSPLLQSVLDTSRTEGDLWRAPNLTDDATVDPTTLQIVDPTPEAIYESDVPAIVQLAGAVNRPNAPQVQATPGKWLVKISADYDDVQVRDLYIPTASRNPTLIGARMRITDIADDFTGLLKILTCVLDVVPS